MIKTDLIILHPADKVDDSMGFSHLIMNHRDSILNAGAAMYIEHDGTTTVIKNRYGMLGVVGDTPRIFNIMVTSYEGVELLRTFTHPSRSKDDSQFANDISSLSRGHLDGYLSKMAEDGEYFSIGGYMSYLSDKLGEMGYSEVRPKAFHMFDDSDILMSGGNVDSVNRLSRLMDPSHIEKVVRHNEYVDRM